MDEEQEEEEVVRPTPPGLGGFSILSILSSIHYNELSVDGSAEGSALGSSSIVDPGHISNTTVSSTSATFSICDPFLDSYCPRNQHPRRRNDPTKHPGNATPATATAKHAFQHRKTRTHNPHVRITRQHRTPSSKTPGSPSPPTSTFEASSSTTKTTTTLLSLPSQAQQRVLEAPWMRYVAVDGVSAVDKMEGGRGEEGHRHSKLGGASATSLIRKFDDHTPIISITSNSKPTEVMAYYSSGLNDILPKPFTKDCLLVVLEKHPIHLMAMQTMNNILAPSESHHSQTRL
ncbi:hypothetical protein BDN72DRAFT_901150 [Pluteus cervinus]|uniref:Uncharacterized protein n=1 Tax=Pluteus cervinus TaxID=181527 RepID=A0ACD3AH73_9AGAR|nr:hypothetical protein BDN72DRAFT_901150 [Pluteus cervinus]